MNYAEDRLDRRVAHNHYDAKQNLRDGESSKKNAEESSGESSPSRSSTQNSLLNELQLAHCNIRRWTNYLKNNTRCDYDHYLHEEADNDRGRASGVGVTTTTNDNHHPNKQEALPANTVSKNKVIQELKHWHEVAGKALRDCGLCKHATFHFGIRWLLEPVDAMAAGDYAQMTELAGFPEIGVLILLYYYNSGTSIESLQEESRIDELIMLEDDEEIMSRNGIDLHDYLRSSSSSSENSTIHQNTEYDSNHFYQSSSKHCGCGLRNCGSMLCFIPPFFLQSSSSAGQVIKRILSSLSDLDRTLSNPQFCQFDHDEVHDQYTNSAASVLEVISKVKQQTSSKSSRKNKHIERNDTERNNTCRNDGNHFSNLMNEIIMAKHTIDESLTFWKSSEDTFNSTDDHFRQLPAPVVLLLIKLLYTQSNRTFLILAAEAMRCISISMSSSTSTMDKGVMTKDFKSHWAYYILIYAVLFGEPMKKHRREIIPYHIPIYDIIYGVDHRYSDYFLVELEKQDSEDVHGNVSIFDTSWNQDISQKLWSIITGLCESASDSSAFHTLYHVDNVNKIPSHQPTFLPYCPLNEHRPIFAVGDSHVLSIAYQTIRIRKYGSIHTDDTNVHSDEMMYRTIVPCPITGLKAWHTRRQMKFFTQYLLRLTLKRLPSWCKCILLSAGEIDCREGIGGVLLEGLYNCCDDAIRKTVQEYVTAVNEIADEFDLQILILPVAPHAYRSAKNGRTKGRGMRRQIMYFWNQCLRDVLCGDAHQQIINSTSLKKPNKRRVFLLDYEEKLRKEEETSPVGFVLNKIYNADFTHMNSAFLPLLEDAIENCECLKELI